MASLFDAPPDVITFADIKWHARRAFRYGIAGAAGVLLDLVLFLLLVRGGVGPFAANILSSGAALTFVYCVSVRRIFRYDGHFVARLFVAYLLYHVSGTLIVSAALSALVHAAVPPALAKIGILPATFAANYLFMSWLTRNRERWIH